MVLGLNRLGCYWTFAGCSLSSRFSVVLYWVLAHMFVPLGMYILSLEFKWRLSPAAKRKLVIKGKRILYIKQKFLLAYLETKSFLFRLLRELLYKGNAFFSSKINFGTVVSGLVSEFFSRTLVGFPGSCAAVFCYFAVGEWLQTMQGLYKCFLEISIFRLYQFKFFIHWHVFYTPLRQQYFESSIFSE